MDDVIKLYLISGFLGSGKTTFLRNMLEQISNKKVGVIVNEFGSIGIDGKVLQSGDIKLVEINNGSLFCSCLKSGFAKTLVAFLDQPIDILFIEASGMADPTSIRTLLSQLMQIAKKNIKTERSYDYKGSICLVDCTTFLEFCDLFTPTKNQILKSNFIVINKIDLISQDKLKNIHDKVISLNPNAFMYDTTFSSIPAEILEKHLSIGDEIDETFNSPWNRPVTYILDMKGIYCENGLTAFCKELAEESIRIKGILQTENGNIHIDVVGDYINIENMVETEAIFPNNRKLVIIGKDSRDFEQTVINAWNKIFKTEINFYES